MTRWYSTTTIQLYMIFSCASLFMWTISNFFTIWWISFSCLPAPAVDHGWYSPPHRRHGLLQDNRRSPLRGQHPGSQPLGADPRPNCDDESALLSVQERDRERQAVHLHVHAGGNERGHTELGSGSQQGGTVSHFHSWSWWWGLGDQY